MAKTTGGNSDTAALADIFANSGVKVAPEDIGPVARTLARIKSAAVLLAPSPSLDETSERFYRLLERDSTETGA